MTLDHDAPSVEDLEFAAQQALEARALFLEELVPPLTPDQQRAANWLTEKALAAQADFYEARDRNGAEVTAVKPHAEPNLDKWQQAAETTVAAYEELAAMETGDDSAYAQAAVDSAKERLRYRQTVQEVSSSVEPEKK
jgi:hypothetical protein